MTAEGYDPTQLVKFGREGMHLPVRYIVTVDDPGQPFVIRLTVDASAGYPECAELRIVRRTDGPAVTSEAIRRIPVARYVRESVPLVAVRVMAEENGHPMVVVDANADDVEALERADGKRRDRITPEKLDEVAAVYTAALDRPSFRGMPTPTEAVREHFQVARSTAGRWVLLARRSGKLPPAKRGQRK